MARGRKINWTETSKKYKERILKFQDDVWNALEDAYIGTFEVYSTVEDISEDSHMDCFAGVILRAAREKGICLLYTSPSPRDRTRSRMPSSA